MSPLVILFARLYFATLHSVVLHSATLHSITVSPSAGQNPLPVALSRWSALNESTICYKHKFWGELYFKN